MCYICYMCYIFSPPGAICDPVPTVVCSRLPGICGHRVKRYYKGESSKMPFMLFLCSIVVDLTFVLTKPILQIAGAKINQKIVTETLSKGLSVSTIDTKDVCHMNNHFFTKV